MDAKREYENILAVLNDEIPDDLPDLGNAGAMTRTYGCTRVRNASDGFYYDPFGVKFRMTPLGPMPDNTRSRNFELDNILNWRSVMPNVNLDAIDWASEAEQIRKSAKSLNGNNTEYLVHNCLVGFLWDELQYMMGFEEALYSIAAEPEETAAFLLAMADFYIEVCERQFQHYKPEIGLLMDHVANSKGLLMNPQSYRRIIKPAQKRLIDALKSMGLRIELHCDGLIEDILPDLAEIGVEIIQPFQVFNDIQMAKKNYGFIAVGGWDAFGKANLQESTEQEVRQSVRDAMDAYGPGGKYIFRNSGVLNDGTQKKAWMIDEAYRYGRNYYRRND